jgi:hypothetical protein
MITENEQKVLQLAKKVFEHFTHDALAIAREIIAMERELKESPVNEESLNDFPISDISAIGLDDPSQPVKYLNEELVYQQQDDFPF